jgi:hypothetical protein
MMKEPPLLSPLLACLPACLAALHSRAAVLQSICMVTRMHAAGAAVDTALVSTFIFGAYMHERTPPCTCIQHRAGVRGVIDLHT